MNTSGDAAEQVVRLSLEGLEVIARITGSGAKEALAMIYSVLKDNEQQNMGKTNLVNMLRNCKNIKIFSMPKRELEKFVKESKKYGIMYCTLLDKNSKSDDSIVDIMVRGEDAARIDRIVERYNLSIADTAELRKEAEKEIDKGIEISEQSKVELENSDELIDDIMGEKESGNVEVVADIINDKNENKIIPLEVLDEKDVAKILGEENGVSETFFEKNQSEPSYKNKGVKNNEKKSVRKTIQEIVEKQFKNANENNSKEREKVPKEKKSKKRDKKNKRVKGAKKHGRAR